ncbi:MAG: hypothetical protein KAI83_04185 [Thiomargarita sp.]|nr:hypothetical protein [Thiomargarita sp.]
MIIWLKITIYGSDGQRWDFHEKIELILQGMSDSRVISQIDPDMTCDEFF